MLADWLTSLLSVDKNTIIVIGLLCGGGTWMLRGQLYNPMLGFAIHPMMTIVSVLVYAMLQAGGLIDPEKMSDWIKGVMAATMAGNGIGIAIGMVFLAFLGDKTAAVETDLMRRNATKAPVKRTARRNFREGLR